MVLCIPLRIGLFKLFLCLLELLRTVLLDEPFGYLLVYPPARAALGLEAEARAYRRSLCAESILPTL